MTDQWVKRKEATMGQSIEPATFSSCIICELPRIPCHLRELVDSVISRRKLVYEAMILVCGKI